MKAGVKSPWSSEEATSSEAFKLREGGMETQGDYMACCHHDQRHGASALEHITDTRLQSAIEMKAIAEPVIRRRAMRHPGEGPVIFGAGTGNPFFTTTARLRRAIEIEADDPQGHPRGRYLFRRPREGSGRGTVQQLVLRRGFPRGLKVMDMTAFTLCNENKLPIIVFDINQLRQPPPHRGGEEGHHRDRLTHEE